MKVLFAVSNEEVSENIVKKYQKEYKEIISYKNVYYFNAILKELQKDKTYDRVVISEELETFTHNQYDQIDKFIFEKLDSISDEASNFKGDDIPIILICSDRRTKSEQMLVKLFGIGIYNALLGTDRTVEELCKLINKPRLKKEGKAYYKIDVEDVKYKAENENDVSEVEIQNILAHYKRLGKNEDKFIESFDNIAAQYNDTQLRIIAKFLPLNVRAVLEEKSPKYQKVMSFNAKISDDLRRKKGDKEAEGTTQKLLKTNNMRETILSKPVVIPSAVNLEKGKKLSKQKIEKQTEEEPIKQIEREIDTYVKKEDQFIKHETQSEADIQKVKMNEEIEDIDTETEISQPIKRGRGRPRKNLVISEDLTEEPVKKKRGRPKKVADIQEENEEIIMPGFEEETDQEEPALSEFENQEQNQEQEEMILPGFNEQNEEQEELAFPEYEQEDQRKEDEVVFPGYEPQEPIMSDFDKNEDEESYEQVQSKELPRIENNIERINESSEQIDLSSLLTEDKKVACFVGTSKNGTSFIVNNVAQVLSSAGISTAILDTTQNKNAYYMYTNNDENLRKIAANCIDNLLVGQANGIKANPNLTVYVPVPEEENQMHRAGEILQTLVKNYSVVLIDCDFKTPTSYFSYSQEIYLIQSLDVLTIQPLTAFLNELKAKQVLDERKLRIVLNKFEKLKRVSDKTIIEGMSSYTDPAMSYMVDLFDKNLIKYMIIPFDEQVYVKYLEVIINCEMSFKGYPKNMIQILTELGNMVYPIEAPKGKNKGNKYRPPALNTNNGFTPNINSTLEQMRKY